MYLHTNKTIVLKCTQGNQEPSENQKTDRLNTHQKQRS